MKFAPAGVVTLLASGNAFWRADLYTFTLLDGTIFRWTTADFNITVGGNTWLSNGAVLSRSALRQALTLEIDTLDLTLAGAALMGGLPISLQALNGIFDDARLQLDCIVGAKPGDVSLGVVPGWFEGRCAGVEPTETEVVVHIRSDLEILTTQRLPKFLYSAMCAHAVYDVNCTLAKAAFTIAGTVASATTTTVTTATAGLIAKAAGYFNLGVLVFTSGALSGVRRAITNWTGTVFTVSPALPSAPAAADGITAYPGCHRTQVDCGVAKFNNLVHFRGFTHIPGA